jgi:MFS transporter, CP family, cyanate transporter
VGPLIPLIRADLGASYAVLGLLTAIPVLCMGLFAPLGAGVAAWLGVRTAVAASVGILVAFGVLRALAPGVELLVVLTFGVGLGIALSGPMLPMFVRTALPQRLVRGTSAYAAGTVLGAAVSTALAVLLAGVVGGWRAALLLFALVGLASVLAWWWLTRGVTPGDASASSPASSRRPGLGELPWRRGVAWLLGVVFGLQSWLYYGTTAWLASVYLERGWSAADAGLVVGLLNFAILGGTLVAPSLGRRIRTRRSQLIVAAAVSTLGILGFSLLPQAAFLWALVVGTGLGTEFTLVLTLPTDISDDPREVGGAAALMLLVGYAIAAAGPFILGVGRDATGSFAASLWLLAGIALALVAVSGTLHPARLRRGEG